MKKSIKYITISFLTIIIFTGLTFYQLKKYNHKKEIKIIESTESFISMTHNFERKIVEEFPIYSDWSKSNNIYSLRKYLYKYHIAVAKKYGIGPIRNDNEILKLSKEGKLVALDNANDFYYFYGVPKKYRYLTPKTKKALEIISERFNQKLREKNIDTNVKLAISSALRPSAYQKKLSKKNANAIGESTHSYGISFDIFYDDYYVFFKPKDNQSTENILYNKLRVRFGFILGDSLRRQFMPLLADTLLELQNEGIIYVTWEKNQRCFHTSIAMP